MDASPPRRHPGLTLIDLMKLVVFAAAAMAWIAPAERIRIALGGPMWVMVMLDLIVVPPILAALSLVLVRRGEGRTRLVLGLLLCSAAAVFVMAVRYLGWIALPGLRRGQASPSEPVASFLVVLVFSAAVLLLVRRLGALGRDDPRTMPGETI